ncbi:MAG: hypothetical protein IPO98_06715 [Saprospiraceae bacterium]|nr:hypothetical protein [Saprospiraceae bacterium]
MNFIDNELKDKFYINVFTILKTPQSKLNIEDWGKDSLIYGKNLFSYFEALGAKQIRNLTKLGSVPYIFQAENGKGLINEIIGASIYDITESNIIINRNLQLGKLNSQTIGLSNNWGDLKFNYIENQGFQEKLIKYLWN